MTHTLARELAQGHSCASTTVGTSMLPLLRDRRDTVLVEPLSGPLRRYDLALYRRPSGQYVLHRVLHVRPDGYVLCGDHQYRCEYPVPHDWMLGVVREFYRDERRCSIHDWRYRFYVHLWCDLFPLRAAVLILLDLLRHVRRCLRRSRYASRP